MANITLPSGRIVRHFEGPVNVDPKGLTLDELRERIAALEARGSMSCTEQERYERLCARLYDESRGADLRVATPLGSAKGRKG